MGNLTLFLTSSLDCYRKTENGKEATKCNNLNHFVDRLKSYKQKIRNFVFIPGYPDGASKTDEYSNIIIQALNFDGFGIENLVIIDHRFDGNIEKTILSADCVFLGGGHVPTQNAYFKEIGLKQILDKYDGVVIGQSAGSMNCAEIVYAQPEIEEEFYDKSFKKLITGLGLTEIKVMPHMNRAKTDCIDGITTYDMCLEDSKTITHYGISDSGFIEINGDKAISFGPTVLFKGGKCIELCGEGEHIEVNKDYQHNENYVK
ncbi:MAG: Type 1 glutamine amidotransferase-like domain-containing protein [Clostridia bacterium]|nr:Type 1 glutamine amidotransferase-like domain-containing protein [Clostridia bacterium]